MSEKLLAEINQLSVPERLELLGQIWNSLVAEDAVPPLSAAQQQEVERRIEKYRQNPDTAKPWSEVRHRLWASVQEKSHL